MTQSNDALAATRTEPVSVKPKQLRKAVIAAGVGSTIEYFDYTIYAIQAVTLAAVFFPSEDPIAGLLSTLAVFAASFLLRPLGGIIIGNIGDRVGRKAQLTIAIIGMGIATLGMGFLPTFAAIGIAAPILLATLRCVQALAAGGEAGGAAAYVVEYAPEGRRGLYASSVQLGVVAGTALATLTLIIVRAVLPAEDVAAWGWRIPFIISGVMTVAAWLYRRTLEESPDFQRMAEKKQVARIPFFELIRHNWVGVVKMAIANLISFSSYYLVFTFMATYFGLTKTIDPVSASFAILATQIISAATMPLYGRLSDSVGRRPVMIGSCIAFIVASYPLFLWIGTGTIPAVIGLLVLGQCVSAFMACMASAYTELFPPQVRASGFSLGFNLAAIFGGGLAPYIATWLMGFTGNDASPAFFIIFTAVLSLIAVLSMKETAHSPLRTE
ncbi:MHS family proline/betaine transporter-like MFS transporter [Microbacterium resistens]|uniref:MHS family proline/betaine transporter-like MFS transporter n=1 Tax=Microbacterium resistens TaxID=156977 RepID=A0ABU1SAG6_9MICO|nr:MFS transporter [Microbacterium resistens]MDR6866612.1 MHS family proline/betaine transporter-like MFS transporter [Microbacterium resistens]